MREHMEIIKQMEAKHGGMWRMDNETLWKYMNTCQSWDEIEEGAIEYFVCDRADMREEWEAAEDYEDVLNAACEKLGLPHLI